LTDKPKKENRELALYLILGGLSALALVSICYYCVVNYNLNQAGQNIFVSTNHDGTDYGFWFIWVAVLFKAVAVVLYQHGSSRLENAYADFKEQRNYEEDMAKYRARKAANKDDTALDRMAVYWEKSRKLSHAHYHSMLKVAHAGMARLQMAIDMMTKAVNGEKLDKKELDHLRAVTPAPTVVFMQVRTQLLKFCGEALTELKNAKELSPASAPQQPVGFLQIRQDPAPEDALAKEMTHDLEMNFNKIAPFGKEDTAKELQDHAAKTQDTLVDAVENAEVAEIKRAVFRALTRLRAATIKEFDTIARLETQAIDAYNDAHHYRAENPLAHLHEDEAPVETDKLKSFH